MGTVYLAMEYFDLGDLAVYLDNILEEDEVKTISRQLVAGLKVMHDHSIVHRDMKPKVGAVGTSFNFLPNLFLEYLCFSS